MADNKLERIEESLDAIGKDVVRVQEAMKRIDDISMSMKELNHNFVASERSRAVTENEVKELKSIMSEMSAKYDDLKARLHEYEKKDSIEGAKASMKMGAIQKVGWFIITTLITAATTIAITLGGGASAPADSGTTSSPKI